jgi:hypothetical protein
MTPRPEDRHSVDFSVFLSFQAADGTGRRVTGRCVDLSASGAKLETKDQLKIRTNILLQSAQFGRMGLASIRYCVRRGMKYEVGLQFVTPFSLSDPVRKKVLTQVLREDAAGSRMS